MSPFGYAIKGPHCHAPPHSYSCLVEEVDSRMLILPITIFTMIIVLFYTQYCWTMPGQALKHVAGHVTFLMEEKKA